MATESRRLFNRWNALAINIGIIIGVGILRLPAEVAAEPHSAGLILVAWTAAGAICRLGGPFSGELAASHARNAGHDLDPKERLGPGADALF